MADIIYVVKVDKGTVKLYNGKNSALIRQIGESGKAKSAIVVGEQVQVTMLDNKVKLYSIKNGALLRTI